MRWFAPIAGAAATESVERSLWKLGSIRHDRSASNSGITYTNDGSCNVPRVYTYDADGNPTTREVIGKATSDPSSFKFPD